VPRLLEPWRKREFRLQPCVCDLWHDHVLFTGNQVTGIIDFGSVKIDHVAVDLARLLGSTIGDDGAQWDIALAAYATLSAEEIELARLLERTGVFVAAMNWLRWLYHEERVYEQPTAVLARLAALRRRLEG
jgi:homoserine kinase type II